MAVVELTGRFWFKRTWSGKLVLLVEERRPQRRLFRRTGDFTLRWREARFLDFAEPALSALVDLGRLQRADGGRARFARPQAVPTPAANDPAARMAS
jgi:hypothetical protein